MYNVERVDRGYNTTVRTMAEAKQVIEHKAIESGQTFLVLKGGEVRAAFKWDEHKSELVRLDWGRSRR